MANTLAMAIKNRRLLESEATRREAAERAYEERLRQLAIINHELRTPLASIKGFATTLLAEDVVWSPADQTDFIQTINDEADKLSRLVEQVLEVSKMDAGRVPIELTQQDLSAIVDRAKGQMNAVTGQHDFSMNIPDNLPPVMADSQRTGQILVNLVENAVKYSPAGTAIRLVALEDGDFIRINVSDQGRGIAPEDRKKVFQAFYRSEKTAGATKAKGVGLGLHICQRLVEAQGGKIEIMEHEGPGTTISFTIPLALTSEQAEANK
jgi:K+-sensing histidine kinase KdpD